MITQQVQLIEYRGESAADIYNLSNINYVDKIYFIDSNGNYIGWFSQITQSYSHLQGITTLEPNGAYLVYSKPNAVYPYNLFVNALDDRVITNSGNIEVLRDLIADNRNFSEASYSDLLNNHSALSGVVEANRVFSRQIDTLTLEELIQVSGDLTEEITMGDYQSRSIIYLTSGILNSAILSVSGTWTNDLNNANNEISAVSGNFVFDSGRIDDLYQTSDVLSANFVSVSGDLVATSGLLDGKITEVSGVLDNRISTEFSNLLGSVPDSLDTLSEIAEALNNNPDLGDFVNNINVATQDNSQLISATSGYLEFHNDSSNSALETSILSHVNSTSGVLNSKITAASNTAHEELVAASGKLFNDLIAASGTLFDYILDRPRYEFDVIPNNESPGSTSAFRFSGVGINESNQDNPTIYLRRGETYHFNINARYHPFYIKTERTTGTSNMYNFGVTNNGYTDRTIVFEVPYNAPDILYYQCSNHAAMGGILYTTQPTDFTGSIDGGLANSFSDTVGTTTTITPSTTQSPETYDTTANTPYSQPGGGLSFNSGDSQDSIEFSIITTINNPLATTTLVLYLNNAQRSSINITDEYRNSGNTFRVTLDGNAYVVGFGDGVAENSWYRIDL